MLDHSHLELNLKFCGRGIGKGCPKIKTRCTNVNKKTNKYIFIPHFQILLGPNTAVSGGMSGMMPPPPGKM